MSLPRSFPRAFFALLAVLSLLAARIFAQRQVEFLGRGVIALRGVDTGGNGTNNWSGSGVNQVYVGWRLFASDPETVGFNVYRSAAGAAAVKLNATPITASTNYIDTTATLTVANAYYVTAVVNGVEGAPSEAWTLPANTTAEPCFTIPMPALPDGAHYVHLAWVGDLDGDGYTDIVVDRLPTAGGTTRVEAYSTRTRTRLWSIDCGPNSGSLISAGQNDGVTVYDFDGDGRCEVVVKSVPGTVFGDGAVLPGSGTSVYLSVVEGATGHELSRFQVATAIAASTDAKNIGVAFPDGVHPSLIVMDEAHNFSAYDVAPSTFALTLRWKLTSPTSPYPHGHGFRVDDVDGDGRDEVSDIGMAVKSDGTLLFQNELNHGDRYHITDIDPDRPGLECFAVQQDNPSQLSYVLYDAATGQMIWRKYSPTQVDNGRGNVASIDSHFNAMQSWSAASSTIVDEDGNPVSNTQPVCNMSLWWDDDLLRETLNRQLVDKWNSSATAGGTSRLLTGYNFHGANYSWRDAVPFYGDIFGDWREEIVTESGDDTTLIVFSTTKAAATRTYTLLQDPQYRCDLTIKGYMQTHQPGFYFGGGMPRAPRAPVWKGDLTWVGSASGNVWDTSTARWKTSATGAASTYANGQSVLFDLTGVSSSSVSLTGSLTPSQVVVHAPKGQSYTFGGSGSLTGGMTLTKGGQGALILSGNHSYTGATVVSEGSLVVNGSLTGSAVRVDSRGMLGGSGTISSAVSLPEPRSALAPGGLGVAGTLTLSGGLTLGSLSTVYLDLPATAAGAADRVAITGNLSLSGANVVYLQLNLLGGTLAPGTYTLFTYTGTFTGNLSVFTLRGAAACSCTLANTGSAITLTVGALRASSAVTWAGGTGGVWKLNGGAGWLKGGSADGFVTGDTATFDDSGSATPAITLATAVQPAATVFNSAANYTLGGSGAIAGAGGLTKSGTGVLTVGTANTYTGPTSVNGGVLAIPSLADGGQPSPIGASDNSASNLVLNGGTLRLTTGSTSSFRNLTVGASGGTLDLPAEGSLLSLSGSIGGSGALVKSGPGRLLLNAVNSYTGGTVIQGGTVVLTASREDNSPTSPIQYGLGAGSVTLQGGTLSLSDTSVGDLDFVDSRAFWPIVVPAGFTGRLEANGRMNLGGALTGGGDFTFLTPYVRTDITGNWSAFAGKISVIADGDGGDFRIANSAGLPAAWLDLAAGVYAYSRVSGTNTINIGALSGAAGSVLNAGTGSGLGQNYPAIWRIGARNLDTTFAGVISGTSVVTKVGTGTLTLSGASTYTGSTTVSAGRLALSGGSLSGSAVTVQSGAGFGGAGAVTGNVTFNSGSTLLASTTAPLAITGNLSLGGTITVSPAPGAVLAGGTYPLLTYTGTLSGMPSFAWNGPGYSATFDTSAAGQISFTLTKTTLPPTGLVALPDNAQAGLSWTAAASAVSYTVKRSSTAGGPYAAVASGIVSTVYTDAGLTNGVTYYYVVATVAADGSTADSSEAFISVGPSTPRAFLRLDETSGATAADSSGNGWAGALVSSPTWSAGRLNNALGLASASSQHVTLPAGILSGLNDFTLSAWIRLNSLDTWARVFDFGTGTGNYLFLTTRYSTANLPRFAIKTSAASAEQTINSSVTLAIGVWTHVAITLSGTTGTLYLNGIAVGANSAMTLTPAGLGATTQNYLGRSQFSSDPYFNGAIDEFQVFARALTAAEVSALAAPPAAPSDLTATAGNAQVALSWSAISGAGGYSVKRAPSSGGPFATVVTGLNSPAFTDTGLTNGTTYHYVVTAHVGVAESARSTAVPATPLSPIESWRAARFGSPSATGSAADTADPDADGMVNLLEYALGSDPTVGGAVLAPAASLSPSVPPALQLTFHRIADSALVYSVEATDDFMAWTTIWSSTGAANTDGDVTVTAPGDSAAHPRRFLRLRVSY